MGDTQLISPCSPSIYTPGGTRERFEMTTQPEIDTSDKRAASNNWLMIGVSLAVTGAIVATVAIFSRNATLDDSFRSDNKNATMHDKNSFYANCTTSRGCHEIDPHKLLTCLRTPPALCVSFRCNLLLPNARPLPQTVGPTLKLHVRRRRYVGGYTYAGADVKDLCLHVTLQLGQRWKPDPFCSATTLPSSSEDAMVCGAAQSLSRHV